MLYSSAYFPFLSISSLWEPCSTICPLSRTRILSAILTVEYLWLMIKADLPFISFLSLEKIFISVWGSRALEGSSKITSCAPLKKARATAIICHCPILNSSPFLNHLPRMVSYPEEKLEIFLSAVLCFAASLILLISFF